MAQPPVQRTHFVRDATPGELFAVVTSFADYPRLFPDIKATRVLETDGKRRRVEFRLQLVVAIRYVLDLVCDPEAFTVDWTYVEGEVVTGMEGGWRFTARAGGTELDYRVALAIKAPLPGFMVRKVTDTLVSASLPAMFASIEREAAARRGR